MDHRAVEELLDLQKFSPFEFVLNNGDRYAVRYPRFAIVTRTAVYLFSSRDGKMAEGPPTILALRNISQVEPLKEAA
jgi:hypothetical protein